MKREDGRIVLSPSDLMRFQGCRHATALDLAYLDQASGMQRPGAARLQPAADSEGTDLLQRKGEAHERAFLDRLAAAGNSIAEIETKRASFADARRETMARLAAGPGIVYQAALADGSFAGYADFLERVDRPSRLGPFSYEVIDTKLKRSPAPSHVLQLAVYSDLLAAVQGVVPERLHVELGNDQRATLRLADYVHYARHLRRRLESFIASPEATRPEPVAACSLCRWREHCAAEWEATDSLALVAGMRRDQRRKLEAAGVVKLAALARRRKAVPGLAPETLTRLADQARLQHGRRQGGPPAFELRPGVEAGKGLGRMPRPAAGDLFFDMEGDPLVEGGLEYLFGVYHEAEGEGRFQAFWAHDAAAERVATLAVLEFFAAHLAAHPDACIYHYNHYEPTALKRLVCRHSVGEGILDQLLWDRRFVDLYRVVQQGLIASEPGYSIKDLEVFYAGRRTEAVASAGDSIVAYERWRETGDGALLEQIRAYNEADCRSTKGLRDWLVRDVRPKGMAWSDLARADEDRQSNSERIGAREASYAALREAMAGIGGPLAGEPAKLLAELTQFHVREAKPQWWAMFDHAEWETSELVDDLDSLGDLQALGPARAEKQSLLRTYRFPAQDTKLRAGSRVRARLQGLPTVHIERLDAAALEVDVKFGSRAGQPPDNLDLIPGGALDSVVLQRAVLRVAEDVRAGGGGYPALEAILARLPPRIEGVRPGRPLLSGAGDPVASTVDCICRLQSSSLPIQGPPGTGKTYVAALAIVALARAGKRIGVTSNSHKAIDNLLIAAAERAAATGAPLSAIKKADEGEALALARIAVTSATGDPRLATCSLVGGTAWLFAREEHDRQLDYLFVDEAGQMSLASLVAAGTAARNIVLVGDPMQLSQPIQGTHPGQSGSSGLAYVLGDAATVAPDRGIFLPVTRRMHPSICRYVSDVVYDGRLASDAGAARQTLRLDRRAAHLPAAGLHFMAIEHDANSQSSGEEAAAVLATWQALQGQVFSDRDGRERPIGAADILVVTPYNAQVNLLRRTLPATARVGTIDKFQGQEAPVAIVSMVTSSAAEMPRNLEFLFSVNRLNVAISRAQVLAIVIASPRLLDVPCQTIAQMRLVNALCGVAAMGRQQE